MGASMAGFNPDSLTPLQGAPSVRNTYQADPRPAQAMGAAVAGIGRQAQELAQQVQDRNDSAAVIGATAKLYDSWNQWNDPNNPEGAEKYKGEQSLGQKQAYMQQLDQMASGINAGLTDPQRRAFAQQLMSFRAQKDMALNDSMLRNHEIYLQASTAASVQTFENSAFSARLAGDEAGAEDALDKAVGAQKNQMLHLGLDETTIAAASAQITSRHYAAVTRSLLDGNNQQDGIAFYQQHADQMSVADRLAVDGAAKAAIKDQTADAWMTAHAAGTPPPAGTLVEGAATTPEQVTALANSMGGKDGFLNVREGTGKNPYSSAVGFGQIIDGTWRTLVNRYEPQAAAGLTDTQLLALRTENPALAQRMSAAYRNEIGQGLLKAGYPVTQQTIYLGYQFGEVGAQRILSASPNAPIGPLLDALNPKQVPGNVAKINRIDGTQTVGAFLQSRGIMGAAPANEGVGPRSFDPNSDTVTVTSSNAGMMYDRDERAAQTATSAPAQHNADGTRNWVLMLEDASKIENRAIRERVMQLVGERMRIDKLKQQAQTDAMESGLSQAVQSMSPTDTAPAFTAEQKAYMDANPGTAAAVQKMVTARRMSVFQQTDPVLLQNMRNLASDAPDQFANINFDSPLNMSNFSPEDRAEFKSMQAKLHGGTASVADWQSESGQLSMMHDNLGIGGADNKALQGQFLSSYMAEKQAWIAANGGVAPNADQRWGLMQRLALPMEQTNSHMFWWDTHSSTPSWKIDPNSAPDAPYEVPAAYRAQIVAELAARGVRNPSPQLILQVYLNRNGSRVYKNPTPSEFYVVPSQPQPKAK